MLYHEINHPNPVPARSGLDKTHWTVLLSGGLDSAMSLWLVLSAGAAVDCLYINWGQTAKDVEYLAFKQIVSAAMKRFGPRNVDSVHMVSPLGLLYDGVDTPADIHDADGATLWGEKNPAYVYEDHFTPARNLNILSLAVAHAVQRRSRGIIAGFSDVAYKNPDVDRRLIPAPPDQSLYWLTMFDDVIHFEGVRLDFWYPLLLQKRDDVLADASLGDIFDSFPIDAVVACSSVPACGECTNCIPLMKSRDIFLRGTSANHG